MASEQAEKHLTLEVLTEGVFEAAAVMAVRRSLAALRLARAFEGIAARAGEAALWRDAYLVSALLDVSWQ